jgi:hypothetical protein
MRHSTLEDDRPENSRAVPAVPGWWCRAGFAITLAQLLPALLVHPALAAPTPDEILFESRELKIYRTLSRDGTPVVVLTNVDAEGNFLSGRAAPGSTPGTCPDPRASVACAGQGTDGRETPGRADSAPAPGESSSAGSVKVVVNRDGGAAPLDQRDVEVTADGSGGTTVIININPPAPPERETVVVPGPSPYPIVAIGGIVGAYRYPSHLNFLGYGLDTSSPSWFGGLGLNAGNGFGLKNGTPCERGFDCMFGPREPHP